MAAFAAYLSLQQRLGPGPASTISVATPVVALAVSSAFEGYRPDLWTGAGVVLAIAGHLLILGLGFGHVTATAPE